MIKDPVTQFIQSESEGIRGTETWMWDWSKPEAHQARANRAGIDHENPRNDMKIRPPLMVPTIK